MLTPHIPLVHSKALVVFNLSFGSDWQLVSTGAACPKLVNLIIMFAGTYACHICASGMSTWDMFLVPSCGYACTYPLPSGSLH